MTHDQVSTSQTSSLEPYIIETGAISSVYPASRHEINTIDVDPIQLTAANGSNITSRGTKDINICLANRNYTCTFRLAQVTHSLHGADFLAHDRHIAKHRLLVTDPFRATQ